MSTPRKFALRALDAKPRRLREQQSTLARSRGEICRHQLVPPASPAPDRISRLRLACRLTALCLLFPAVGKTQAPARNSYTDQKLQTAESYLREHDYRQAKELLEQILRQSPDSYGANELMGLALASEGNEKGATPFFERAVRVKPDSAEAHENLATNMLRLKRIAAAEQEFKRAAVLKPADYTINHALGEFYLSRGRAPEAVPYLQKAQEGSPDSYANGRDLALAEIQSGRLVDAGNQIVALMRVKEAGELHELLAEVKEGQKDYLAAGKEYQRAAQIDPSENNIFAWGEELIRHRTPQPATEVLNRGVELYPQSARLQIALGIALLMRESYGPAVDAFCRAVDLDPQDPRPYSFLAGIYAISPSRAAEVSQRLGQLVRIQPRNAQARYYYAMSLWKSVRMETQATDLSRVESLLRAAINLDPRFAEAHFQLGVLCSEEKRDSEALAEFQKAIDLDANLADAHYRLGQALLRRGDKVGGEKELDISSRLHTRQLDEREKLNSEILRFVYTEPHSSAASSVPH